MKQLGTIFGSEPRVKIMRLFLFNTERAFDAKDVVDRSKIPATIARRELNVLHKVGFLHKKNFTKELIIKPVGRGKEQSIKKVKASGWMLNQKFPLVQPLYSLLIDSELIKTHELPKRFRGAGNLKLLVLSGIFVKDNDRSLDILIVGSKMKKPQIERMMKNLEAEIGKEIRYAVFDEEEFLYRIDMYDKLLRDVFDYAHTKVVNKMNRRL